MCCAKGFRSPGNLWVTSLWTSSGKSVESKAQILLFPEYGAMEITSLFSESERTDLRAQAKKFLPFVEDFKRTFSELAKKHNVYIIAPSLPLLQSETLTTNRVFVFAPDGKIDFQDKFFMTRFEDEEWNVKVGEPIIKVFDTG